MLDPCATDLLHSLATASPISPTLSTGIVLAAHERLTVRDCSHCVWPPIRLTVLAACETAIPGLALPDETVSLASASA